MYHDIFQKKNNYDFLETIDIKGTADKVYMHTYLTLTSSFLTLLENISFVKVMVLKRNISLLCYKF